MDSSSSFFPLLRGLILAACSSHPSLQLLSLNSSEVGARGNEGLAQPLGSGENGFGMIRSEKNYGIRAFCSPFSPLPIWFSSVLPFTNSILLIVCYFGALAFILLIGSHVAQVGLEICL